MKNTLENKAKLFAQYWGQLVMRENGKRQVNHYNVGYLDEGKPDHWLELKPLSSITDEDAVEIGKMLGWKYPETYKQEIIENHPYGDSLEQPDVDILRSKGYALPYMGLSVEKLIEYGWVKFKN